MDPCMQSLKIALKVCLIVPPCQAVHSRCRVLFEFEERLSEVIRADVMEERGELLLCPLPCCDTVARFCARPVLCWLAFPSAPALGSTDSAADRSALFTGFTATTAGSDFSRSCIIGYGSSPSRCGPWGTTCPSAERETSQVPTWSFCA